MSKPNISVVVPAYNAEKTIGLCLDSILRQNYPQDKMEVLVVDNNSMDSTAEIIKSYPVTYLFEDKIQSPSGARNKGIVNARHGLIAFIDSDCIADEHWLANGITSLDDESVGAVGGKILAYKPETYIEEYQDRSGVLWHVVSDEAHARREARLVTANAFFRKDVFDTLGLFDLRYKGAGEDTDICYAMLRHTNYKLTYNEHALVWHKHRTNLRQFCKQYVRYGYNNMFLDQKFYPEIVNEMHESADNHGVLRTFYWRFLYRETCRECCAVFPALGRYLTSFKRADKTALFDSVLFALSKIAFVRGEIRAFKEIRAVREKLTEDIRP
ncbi:MAG: glycosyltransferase [Candidatus Auribacter fodinae]|jgi:glycosyltransferase involved in cell wall biosynthesis|uniref:Glycosyltransferase n=1 Tax=Candidatus Auribacter fodinae TaxID=2093366 RepID=A0A3A4RJP5_9BACT|nr:MAG: glycosyltransferase [Candidatus Auribacter fodinae]